ncbi:MAG TPA: branched-chain amino acid ABC transporter permease [Proteobacteria bacterium]|nr:leucine/isoleucine/valine transporter permease subunit [bacterium BMS3Abin14]HDL53277.1 branched-chain amino acid ABC transporter permease [Pseudomonadota bacterium]
MQQCGIFHENYKKDMAIFQTPFIKVWMALFFIFLATFPFIAHPINSIIGINTLYLANLIGIYIIGAQGLNILTGYTGQISLGHGAFMGVGAYASAILTMRLGFPFWIALPLAGLITAVIGMIFGIPSLRLKGLYLAIATMAAQFIIEYGMRNWTALTGGSAGMTVRPPSFFGILLDTDRSYYYLIYFFVILATLYTKNVTRTRPGRAFVAIRDRYLSAEVMGVNVWLYRILSFGVSSFMVGIAGSLWAHYVLVVSDEHFGIWLSVQYLAMIIIGGMGHVLGAIYGAIFMTVLPELLRIPEHALTTVYPDIFAIFNSLRDGVFGLIIILFLIFEPDGLAARWHTIRNYWKLWPFSY